MTIPRIRHLAIRCRDVARSVAFYRDGLGFAQIGPRGPGMDLSDGTLNITILPFVGTPPPPPEEGSEQIHFGIIVPDARALYRHLIARGVPVVRDDIKERGDVTEAEPAGSYKILDPDGNVIDVTDNLSEWRGVG